MGARTRLSRNSRMQSQGSSGHQEGDGRRSLGRRARMTVTDMPAPHTTVTQRLVGLAGARGEHPALVGGPATWPGGHTQPRGPGGDPADRGGGPGLARAAEPRRRRGVRPRRGELRAGRACDQGGRWGAVSDQRGQHGSCGGRAAQGLRRAAARHRGPAGACRAERGGRLVGQAGHRVRRGAGHRPVLVAAVPRAVPAGAAPAPPTWAWCPIRPGRTAGWDPTR